MSLTHTTCRVLGFCLVFAAFGARAAAVDIPCSVPELNPGSMASALTMLTAGAFLLTARRRKD